MATGADPTGAQPPTVPRYALGVGITAFAILSQYFVPQTWAPARIVYGNLPGDLLVVYGIPIVAFLLLVGVGPLRQWRANLGAAAWEGLGWFGLLSILALIVVLGLAVVYVIVDPSVLQLLDRANPEITQAAGDPGFWIGFSFVIGAVEETIFRGWIFGFWKDRRGSWVVPALWTSALFAGLHLYYGTTYGAASPLIFPTLFLAGFAFAATYHFSGGNLIVPALLHGQMDAIAFLTILSVPVADALHYAVIIVGACLALVAYVLWGPTGPRSGPVGALVRFLGSGGATVAGPTEAPPL